MFKALFDINQDTSRTIFDFFCYGDSIKRTRLLITNGLVNQGFKNVCPSEKVRIAYNDYGEIFQLDDSEKMVEYPYPSSISDIRPVEIMSSFLASQNLKPEWTNCNGDYGSLNMSTGRWTGAIAEVSEFIKNVHTVMKSSDS